MSFEAYASKSFTEKDDKILQLQEKNIELERKVMDLEESVKAKVNIPLMSKNIQLTHSTSLQDEIIKAKTEAVTLMSADFSLKSKTTVDQLEDTRAEMKKMQQTFAEQEHQWRESKSMIQV